jgi:hypothetical protein
MDKMAGILTPLIVQYAQYHSCHSSEHLVRVSQHGRTCRIRTMGGRELPFNNPCGSWIKEIHLSKKEVRPSAERGTWIPQSDGEPIELQQKERVSHQDALRKHDGTRETVIWNRELPKPTMPCLVESPGRSALIRVPEPGSALAHHLAIQTTMRPSPRTRSEKSQSSAPPQIS